MAHNKDDGGDDPPRVRATSLCAGLGPLGLRWSLTRVVKTFTTEVAELSAVLVEFNTNLVHNRQLRIAR